MKERYKIELGLGRYYQEFECRLYVRSNWLIFHWWCHLRTIRGEQNDVIKQALRWQKRFEIAPNNIIDLTVDHNIDYEI